MDAAGQAVVKVEEPTLTFVGPELAERDPKTRPAFLKALCAFQGEALALPKSASGHGYRYTDLASTLSTIRPLLTQHGLVLTFRAWTVRRGVLAVRAVLEHVDGWHESTQLVAPITDGMTKGKGGGYNMNMCQGQGAAQTYMQRYAMMSLLGLTAAIDTDGVAEGMAQERVRDDTPPDDPPRGGRQQGRRQQGGRQQGRYQRPADGRPKDEAWRTAPQQQEGPPDDEDLPF